jgi:hypothetical protein
VPDVPYGFVALDEVARCLGVARQTVLHKVQRGELAAVQVITGTAKGSAFRYPPTNAGLLDQGRRRGGQCEVGAGGPSRTTFSRPARKSSCPRCRSLSRRGEV